jgi:hypothetical protein
VRLEPGVNGAVRASSLGEISRPGSHVNQHAGGKQLGQGPPYKGWARILLNPPCTVAAFVVNSEPLTWARPLLRVCVGPELSRCVHQTKSSCPTTPTFLLSLRVVGLKSIFLADACLILRGQFDSGVTNKNLIESGVPDSKKSKRCLNLRFNQDGDLTLSFIKAEVTELSKNRNGVSI